MACNHYRSNNGAVPSATSSFIRSKDAAVNPNLHNICPGDRYTVHFSPGSCAPLKGLTCITVTEISCGDTTGANNGWFKFVITDNLDPASSKPANLLHSALNSGNVGHDKQGKQKKKNANGKYCADNDPLQLVSLYGNANTGKLGAMFIADENGQHFTFYVTLVTDGSVCCTPCGSTPGGWKGATADEGCGCCNPCPCKCPEPTPSASTSASYSC